MAAYISDRKYLGKEKIVVAMDIGTTQSADRNTFTAAVAYAHLYPQALPQVSLVTQWPQQAIASGSAKIPTLVLYQNGEYVTCGQEAVKKMEDDMENTYSVAKWFKLHLHPETIKASRGPNSPPPLQIPDLPSGIDKERVYIDVIKYLFINTKRHFVEKTPGGVAIWDRLRSSMEFIFAIPNGWDSKQQNFLRQAAIAAGLVSSSDAAMQINFVSEGEASVHFALAYGSTKAWLEDGMEFAVVDAGGSTVDSTLYTCASMSPELELKEVRQSECVQAGGVSVDDSMKRILKERLSGSNFDDDESIQSIISAFELKTKRLFTGSGDSNETFGGKRDNDKSRGIIQGKIVLNQDEIASSFNDAILAITHSINTLLQGRTIRFLILVGGFGESPYLKSKLSEIVRSKGATIVTAEQPTKKAAAEGALIWYVQKYVKARAVRATFGTNPLMLYDPSIHSERSRLAYEDREGTKVVSDSFQMWVQKGTVLDDSFSFVREYYKVLPAWWKWVVATFLTFTEVEIYMWEGEGDHPTWAKNEDGEDTCHGQPPLAPATGSSRLPNWESD
ncbi:hypothetical protein FRC16_000428, partial [Serendipita sp. 398]